MLGRGLRRRCPRCGEPAYVSFFQMRYRCARCGLRFEREPGYWVGAMIINTTVTFATFLVVFGGAIVLTWPDVPWIWVLIATGLVNLAVPILFSPVSKTLWLALELGWHPLEDDELAEAARHAGGQTPS